MIQEKTLKNNLPLTLKENKFKNNKIKNIAIYDKYIEFNFKKANKILECGQDLWFQLKENTQTFEQKLKLKSMFTCKDRFCPFCNWRRQMKYSKMIYNHLQDLQQDKKLRYIFLTLTVKNCHIDNLRETITDMSKSFQRMKQTVKWKNSILGFLRVLEYTIQKDNQDMIHPHFHILLVVEPSYFNSRYNKYLKQSDFSSMWQKALRVDYVPSVDIRIIKPNKDKKADVAVISEMCKYPLKDTDISRLSVSNFEKLTQELKGIRNINAGGVLKNILKSVDKIDDDLIKIDNENDELWRVLRDNILYSFENRNGNLNYYKGVN